MAEAGLTCGHMWHTLRHGSARWSRHCWSAKTLSVHHVPWGARLLHIGVSQAMAVAEGKIILMQGAANLA